MMGKEDEEEGKGSKESLQQRLKARRRVSKQASKQAKQRLPDLDNRD
jgi:hypothetical protein